MPNSRPRYPRYSLFSLLLVMTLAAALVGWWVASQSEHSVRRELANVQQELSRHTGQLAIVDPGRAQAIRVRDTVDDRFRWRWRVYLPEDRSYSLNVMTFDVPLDGVLHEDLVNDPKRSVETSFSTRNEFLFEVSMTPASTGSGWEWFCAVDGNTVCGGRLSDFVPEEQFDTSHSVKKYREQVMWENGEHPLLLLCRDLEADRTHSRPGSCPGFAVWFKGEGPAAKVDEATLPSS